MTCIVGKNNVDTFSYDDTRLREWSNKSMLKCPVCGKRMLYCHGDYKNPYFRHEKNSDCPDTYSEGVTQEHIEGIKILYEWLKNNDDVTDLELEKWIKETHQRPDIYFKYKDEEYCIEYQCSPISTQYAKRHDLYRLQEINDIWILGMDKYIECPYKYLEKLIHRNILFEKRAKTIESELLNSDNNLLYLNKNNGRLYITNNKLTENSTRTKTGYYSNEDYTVKMKVLYNYNLRSIDLNMLDFKIFNNKSDDYINNLSDNYIKIIQDKEVEFIKEIISNNINLEILDTNNNKEKYTIEYKDINSNTYCISYDYSKCTINGFKFNKKDAELYFNDKNTLCLNLNMEYNNIFKYLINKEYYIEGDSIRFIEDNIKEFEMFKSKEINIKKEQHKKHIEYILKEYDSYINSKYDTNINIGYGFFKREQDYFYISIEYNDFSKEIEYKFNYYKFDLINILLDMEDMIKRNILNQINNINLIYGIKKHYEYNLSDDFSYMYILQKEENNQIYYEYNIDFKLRDSVNIYIYSNLLKVSDNIYRFDESNKRKILMNIISKEFRKRKYAL